MTNASSTCGETTIIVRNYLEMARREALGDRAQAGLCSASVFEVVSSALFASGCREYSCLWPEDAIDATSGGGGTTVNLFDLGLIKRERLPIERRQRCVAL